MTKIPIRIFMSVFHFHPQVIHDKCIDVCLPFTNFVVALLEPCPALWSIRMRVGEILSRKRESNLCIYG